MSIIRSIREQIGVDYNRPDISKMEGFIEELNNNPVALEYLKTERGLTDDTINHFKLGFDPKREAISIPIFKGDELINIKYRFLNPVKSKYSSERGAETWLYNDVGIDIGNKKDGVLIVEGEFDLMSVYQTGIKNVVSVAGGKDSYGIWIERIDNIPRIYIAYDNDKGGKESAIKIADRLGVEKCFEVSYPEGLKDANEYLKSHTKDDFKDLIKKAKPYYNYQFKGLGDIIESLRTKTNTNITTEFIPNVKIEKDWMIVVSGSTNTGKCHAKGTKLLMYDGSIKNVEDVEIGDQLMGANSKPRNVLSLANGTEEMYRIHERNEYYDVNKSHILSLKSVRWDRKTKQTKTVYNEKTVEELLEMKPETQRVYRGWKTDVDFKWNHLELDPYFVGLWLGDGSSSKTQITTEDDKIELYLNNYCDELGLSVTKRTQKNNNSCTFDFVGIRGKKGGNYIRNWLKKYNLLNNKHIPQVYKINSYYNRLELLAGLIDTDGSLGKTKRGESFEIIQKNTQLANDIVFLARSLGFRVKISKTIKSIKSINFTGEYNRIFIFGNLSLIPTRLKRKQSTFCSKKNWLTSRLEIESIGIGKYYGFTLDDDGLYLLDSFTVTHNTSLVLNIADDFVNQELPVLIMPFERGIESVGKRFMSVMLDKTNEDFSYLSDTDWVDVINDCIDKPLYFSVPKKDEIVETIIKAKRLFNTKIVIVDHLDYLIRHVSGNREAEIANTLQNLKRVAEEHGIIIIIVSHIRKIEQAGSAIQRKPNLDDLKGSSSLSQDPECVVLLNPIEEGIDICVAKNKGKMGCKTFDFNPDTGRFSQTEAEKDFESFGQTEAEF